MAPPIVRRTEFAQSACTQVSVDCPGRKHWAQDVSGYSGCEPSEAAFSCPQLPSDSEAFFLLPSEADYRVLSCFWAATLAAQHSIIQVASAAFRSFDDRDAIKTYLVSLFLCLHHLGRMSLKL